ncbi:MAG TPA: ester cyclase [Terriglobales bacterium]|nr:ester cyclase [Terriglobales bacterium]
MADNKENCRRIFEEVWNQKNLNTVDELVADEYVHNDASLPEPQRGVEAYKQFVTLYHRAFPDIHFTIEHMIAEGDMVAIRWNVIGTHRGDLPTLAATGLPMSLTGISIARFRNGKGIESWNNWDGLGMLQQLGAIPVEAKGKAA